MLGKRGVCLLVMLVLGSLWPGIGNAAPKRELGMEGAKLQRQIDALREEIEELKAQGHRPAAGPGKVTHAFGETTISGYGELHYNNDSRTQPRIDAHRMVIGLHHTFNDWLSAHTEADFEHSAQAMELEFAYVDFQVRDTWGIRAGTVLMPVGYLNEFHEPPLFHSVERPQVQSDIIPTTWQEGGAGVYGQLHDNTWQYRLYTVSTLNAANFRADTGIRGGRQRANNAPSRDLGVVGRWEYLGNPGFNWGLSGYYGKANQGNAALGEAGVSIVEGDVKATHGPFEFVGLYAQIGLSDAAKVSQATGRVIGEKMVGYYGEVAYHLLHRFQTEADVTFFTRYEKINTQQAVAAGLTADPANDRQATVIGLAYRPIPPVVAKIDNGFWSNAAGTSWNSFNVGVGYMF